MSINFEKYVGLPFKDIGRNFDGVDCWGLYRLICLHEFGIKLPLLDEHYKNTMEAELIASLVDDNRELLEFFPIEKGREKIGDILIINMLNEPMHVGMVTKRGSMIHIIKRFPTSVIERYNGVRWINKIVGIYRNEKIYDIITRSN